MFTISINTKSISYTCTGADTNTTAAAALSILLAACAFPEFQEVTWTAASGVVTATSALAGRPFTATGSASAGGTVTGATPTANSSPNDLANQLNYSGTTLPVSGDTLIFADSTVSALWNLGQFATVPLVVQQWQSFTGQIGLPENNPAGYVEYRPTYFQALITGLTVGIGVVGSGSGLMRFNAGTSTCACACLNTSSPSSGTDYALRFLGTSASNTLVINSGSVGVAMLPGEVSTLSTATVQGNGTLEIGPNVTLSTATCNAASLTVRCICTQLTFVGGNGLLTPNGTYTTVVAEEGASLVWLGTSTITTLTLAQGSTLDVSADNRAKTITNATVDGNCTVNDPYNAIAYSSPVTINGPIVSGVFVLGPGRTIKVV